MSSTSETPTMSPSETETLRESPQTNGNAPTPQSLAKAESLKSSSLTAAADLIKTLDSAFSEMNSFAVNAAQDAEEARRNARAASELARRYQSGPLLNDSDLLFSSMRVDEEVTSYGSVHQMEPSRPPVPHSNGAISRFPLPSGQSEMTADSPRLRIPKPPSSAERLAQAHAEDVLALSLELERSKQALESEQMSHDETKSALAQAKSKNFQLEAQIEKLLNDMETQREESGRKIDSLEQELSRARVRVNAAEEDAQLALDLAKSNAESREQLESWLQKALQEIQFLRDHGVSSEDQSTGGLPPLNGEGNHSDLKLASPKKVRWADKAPCARPPPPPPSDFPPPASPSSRPSRSLVAEGRRLLNRRNGGQGTDDESTVYSVRSPDHSAEKRRRLRDRLKNLDVHVNIPTPTSAYSVSPMGTPKDTGSSIESLDLYRNTVKVLKDSGKRLNLSGRWWSSHSSPTSDDIHVDTLARHYCTAVEIQLDRKQKEIVELESLFALWEQGVSVDSGRDGNER